MKQFCDKTNYIRTILGDDIGTMGIDINKLYYNSTTTGTNINENGNENNKIKVL